jgi:hypothetical protein
MTVSAARRAQLLHELAHGQDLHAATAVAGVSVDDVRADVGLFVECGKAFRIGIGKLRARLLELVLDRRDITSAAKLAILERELTSRQAEARQFPTEHPSGAAGDGGLAERLAMLSTGELAVVEWVVEGEGRERPEQLYSSVDVTLKVFAERKTFDVERAARARERAAWGLPSQRPVLDPERPLPRNRSLQNVSVNDLALLHPGTVFWSDGRG